MGKIQLPKHTHRQKPKEDMRPLLPGLSRKEPIDGTNLSFVSTSNDEFFLILPTLCWERSSPVRDVSVSFITCPFTDVTLWYTALPKLFQTAEGASGHD